ncbi:LamG-like jellyroll fold domain [Halapricum desulfuricans]|uniref:LamG-like jellyroll fold domain n=1 Tax=Halapricum desulfuricans TaxID=2841257 RepID=A0A897NFS1_9EURY|nr:LamG domain-containing protein [Halapricum desulfuricans]QSG11547.1 LamG-like jellyroll fold domain [Halapricum desulfuricans]
MGTDSTDRGVTPVVGNVLLVAVVIVIGIVLVTLSFSFLEGTGAPSAEASFEYEQTPVGLEMTATAIGTDVTVQLNGRPVTTIEAGDAGESVLVPTAPGDRITVVSQDREKSVLVAREIEDRDEVGDFIAYYTFEAGSGDTLLDRSNNDNDGNLSGEETEWTGNSYEFTGDDYFEVPDLNAPVYEVSEFTFAVSYETDSGTDKQELAEHISGSDNWGVEIKPCENWNSCNDDTTDTYNPNFFADESGGSQSGQIFGGPQPVGQKQVVIGTYNGSATEIYVDGQSKATDSFESEISMGNFFIGTDAENSGSRDNLDGEIYEIRLYYTAFDDQQVRVLTEAME